MIPAVIQAGAPAPAETPILAELASLRRRLAALEAQAIAANASPGAGLFARRWVDLLATIIAEEFGMTVQELVGGSRQRHFTRARFTWAWAVRCIGSYSFPITARLTGYVDHTSVVWAVRRVEQWREASPDFRLVTENLLEIGRKLRARPAEAPADEVAP
jgi:chromosomal replication initiation ATPase DnaA